MDWYYRGGFSFALNIGSGIQERAHCPFPAISPCHWPNASGQVTIRECPCVFRDGDLSDGEGRAQAACRREAVLGNIRYRGGHGRRLLLSTRFVVNELPLRATNNASYTGSAEQLERQVRLHPRLRFSDKQTSFSPTVSTVLFLSFSRTRFLP